jgi:hypothetical protein
MAKYQVVVKTKFSKIERLFDSKEEAQVYIKDALDSMKVEAYTVGPVDKVYALPTGKVQ